MRNIKSTFFTSDWHIGHENVLKFDNRPFSDLHEMHSTLITRYNSTVPQNGICYFLGDMGNKSDEIRKVISKLNGTKVLILGNHDSGMNSMYNCGFDVVVYSATIYIGPHRITMSHCPLPGIRREDTSKMRGSENDNWHGERRPKHRMCIVPDEGQHHLHGHTHARKDRPESYVILDRQFDVGVPGNNYTPVSFSRIESWVMTRGK